MEGLWTVEFGSSSGSFGGGVVYLQNGKLWGGDSSYYYSGSYKRDEKNGFNAIVSARPFIPGSFSVFSTLGQNLELKISGQLIDENHAVAQGAPKGMPGHVIGLKMTKRA